jgi:tetratricopeptide (TPR) repeat protein
LLEAEALRGEEEASINGVRITAAKYERWEKRARIDEKQKSTHTKNVVEAFDTPSSLTRSDSLSCTPSTDFPRTSRHEQSSDMLIVSPSTPLEDQVNSFMRYGSREDCLSPSLAVSSTEATNPGFSPNALLMGSSEPLGSPSNAHVNMDTVQEPEQHFVSPIPLQFSDRDVDIVTRLFSALKMDPINIPLHIPPTQAVAEVLTPATDTVCLQDLEACSHDGRIVTWVDKQAKPYKTASSGSTEVIHYHNEEKAQQGTIILVSYQCNSRKRTTTGALKYPSIDVIFSSSRVVELDPFSLEVYPFPQDQGWPLEVQPIATVYKSQRMDLNDCISKINKLESAALGSKTAATELRWDLAVVYFNLGYYDKAEHQYKQILSVFEQIYGQNSWDYIAAKIHLAESISYSGRSKEGNQLAKDAHILARRFYPGSSLYSSATHILANSLGFLSNFESEEELLREIIQIRLTASGPKHGVTIKVIRNLCNSMADTGKYSESEKLLRVALELSSSATNLSDREKCTIRYDLSKLLYEQGKYADSEALLKETAKISEKLLGIEHKQTLRCMILLCKVLKINKLFSESHDILLNIIEVQIKKSEEIRGRTIRAMADLSVVMIEMRKMEDAYKWLEQALCYCVEIGGIGSGRAEQFFEDLSSIDEVEEQHQAILDLYKRMDIKISRIDAVHFDTVFPALSPEPCLLLLDSQRKPSFLPTSAINTKYLHNGPIS